MKVSLVVIALNEEKSLPSLFDDIKNQTYAHKDIEVILVDSMSSDSTLDIMEDFAKNSDFGAVKILKNIKVKLASGWNVAIKNSTGDVIVKVDAHANIPKDFIKNQVNVILSGEDVCGGIRPNILYEKTKFGEMLLLAEEAAFGSGIADYRRNNSRRYVNSIFHGMYKKEVFDKVGLFDEQLGRTEDNEIHYRIRKNGYKICLDPSIISYQHVRATLKKMLKQKYMNGYWIGLTSGVCPKCFSIYHAVPGVFVMSLVIGGALVPISKLPIIFVGGGYILGNLVMSIISVLSSKSKNIYNVFLPATFLGIHLSYGVGTIVGLCKMPFWRREYLRIKNKS